MQGSTVDAMADAIDAAVSVIYGVSLDYKESANCRMEVGATPSQGLLSPVCCWYTSIRQSNELNGKKCRNVKNA